MGESIEGIELSFAHFGKNQTEILGCRELSLSSWIGWGLQKKGLLWAHVSSATLQGQLCGRVSCCL